MPFRKRNFSQSAVLAAAAGLFAWGSAVSAQSAPPTVQTESLFGQDLISEKSLDEVIMAYLSEESNED